MSRAKVPRVLSPEGEILKVLLGGSKSAPQIVESVNVGRTAVYTNLKDLLIAGWIKQVDDKYAITNEGVEAFWSAVLPDAGSVVEVGREFGIPVHDLVSIAIDLLVAILREGYVPRDVARVLGSYSPGSLEQLVGILKAKAEVVA
jgi:hypothetical protein